MESIIERITSKTAKLNELRKKCQESLLLKKRNSYISLKAQLGFLESSIKSDLVKFNQRAFGKIIKTTFLVGNEKHVSILTNVSSKEVEWLIIAHYGNDIKILEIKEIHTFL